MRKYYRFTRRKATWENIKKLFLDPNESPLNKAFSIFIGVFIGVLPLWGIQGISAFVSAHLFKVNKPLAVVWSHINLTPLFPVLVYFSLKLGALLNGHLDALPALSEISFATAKTYFWLYLLGCVPVALITAGFFGGIAHVVATYIRYSNRKIQPAAAE